MWQAAHKLFYLSIGLYDFVFQKLINSEWEEYIYIYIYIYMQNLPMQFFSCAIITGLSKAKRVLMDCKLTSNQANVLAKLF
jgi:hypothetical protein